MKKYTCLVAIVSLLFLLSCKESKKKEPDKNIDELISELRSQDTAIRYPAIERLENNIILDEGALQMIEAASGKFPPTRYDFITIPAMMIEAATKYPSEMYIEPLKKQFPSLDDNAREKALIFLAGYSNEKSVEAYLQLVLRYKNEFDFLTTGAMDKNTYRSHLFPQLLEAIDNKKIAPDILLLLLPELQMESKPTNRYAKWLPQIFSLEDSLYHALMNKQTVLSSMNDIWEDGDYMEQRTSLGIIIDVMGYLQEVSMPERLAKYIDQKDNHVKLYAVLSALRHKMEPSKDAYLSLAGDPETRNTLYDELVRMNKAEFFPDRHKTQVDFAESNMVNWLLYPTELGRKPDAIELMKVFTDRSGPYEVEYYLFRFRSDHEDWKQDGWMAGISGYFKVDEKPSTEAYGNTFSTFEKWESKRPEDHLAEITDVVQKSQDELKKK